MRIRKILRPVSPRILEMNILEFMKSLVFTAFSISGLHFQALKISSALDDFYLHEHKSLDELMKSLGCTDPQKTLLLRSDPHRALLHRANFESSCSTIHETNQYTRSAHTLINTLLRCSSRDISYAAHDQMLAATMTISTL